MEKKSKAEEINFLLDPMQPSPNGDNRVFEPYDEKHEEEVKKKKTPHQKEDVKDAPPQEEDK